MSVTIKASSENRHSPLLPAINIHSTPPILSLGLMLYVKGWTQSLAAIDHSLVTRPGFSCGNCSLASKEHVVYQVLLDHLLSSAYDWVIIFCSRCLVSCGVSLAFAGREAGSCLSSSGSWVCSSVARRHSTRSMQEASATTEDQKSLL